jgi:hypothetical protein
MPNGMFRRCVPGDDAFATEVLAGALFFTLHVRRGESPNLSVLDAMKRSPLRKYG